MISYVALDSNVAPNNFANNRFCCGTEFAKSMDLNMAPNLQIAEIQTWQGEELNKLRLPF